jgi:hypothetical protein
MRIPDVAVAGGIDVATGLGGTSRVGEGTICGGMLGPGKGDGSCGTSVAAGLQLAKISMNIRLPNRKIGFR